MPSETLDAVKLKLPTELVVDATGAKELDTLVTAGKLNPPTLCDANENVVVKLMPFDFDETLTTESEGLKLKLPGAGLVVVSDDVLTLELFVAVVPNTKSALAVVTVVFISGLALVTTALSGFPNTNPDALNGVSLEFSLLSELTSFAPNLNPVPKLVVFVSAPNLNPLAELLAFFSSSDTVTVLPNLNPDAELFDDPASNLNPPVAFAASLDLSIPLLVTLKPDSVGLLSLLLNVKPPVLGILILPDDDDVLLDTGMLNPLDCDMLNVFAQLGTEKQDKDLNRTVKV